MGGRFFSAGGCLFATSFIGLHSTCDDGATWKVGGTTAKAADPRLGYIDRLQGDAGLLVAGASGDEEPFFSYDKGRTWRTATPFMPGGMELDGIFQDGSRLWLSAGSTYFSDDGGKSWRLSHAPSGVAYAKQGGLLWVYGPYTPLTFSSDSGETWISRDVPVPDYLGSLNPSGPVYAGGKLFTSGRFDSPGMPGGVFMSSDTGKTWVSRNRGLPPFPRSPTDSVMSGGSAVFALGDVLFELTHEGIYRSKDLGANWQSANSGISRAALENGGLETLFIHADQIYGRAFVNGRYIWFTSADTARSWRTWNPGFGDIESLNFTASSVLAFRRGWDTALSDPVYQSKDGMKTWNQLRGPWTTALSPTPVSLYASGSQIYVAGDFVQSASTDFKRNYWHSPDEGATWESDSGLIYQEAFRWQAALNNARFRSEGWTLGVSTDSGRTWKTSLSAGKVDESAILDQILMVRIRDSLFVTSNDGRTWRASHVGKESSPVEGITAYGGRFFAATRLGLQVSLNGLDWEDAKETGLTIPEIRAIAVTGNAMMTATYKGLFVSKDMGAHWQASALPQVTGSLVETKVAWLGVWKHAFLAGVPGRAIWISTDTGQSWTRLYTPILMGMCAGSDTLIFDGTAGNIMYAPDLTPSPKVWAKSPPLVSGNPALALADGGLYLSYTEGAFVSEAPGASWSQVKFPGQAPADFLAGDGMRLAVSSSDGLFIRPAANMEWQPIGSGLPKEEVSALALDHGRLFAGLITQGLWMNSALPVAIAPAAAGALVARPAIFPGSDGSLVFRVNLSGPARLRLSLHTASGRTLDDLAVSARPGIRELRPNARVKGVSYYRLEVDPEAGGGPRQTFRGRLASFR